MVWVPEPPKVMTGVPLVSPGRSGGNVASMRNDRERWWLKGGVRPDQCVAAYQPIRAASLLASYINLARPGTFNAAPGVETTFNASTGWTFNGSTQYLLTGIDIPTTNVSIIFNLKSTGVTFGAYGNRFFGFEDVGSGTGGLGVYYPSQNSQQLIMRNGATNYDMLWGTVSINVRSCFTISISSDAGTTLYTNGNITNSNSDAKQYAKTVSNLTLGAPGANRTSFHFKGDIYSVSIYNTPLTADQVSAITNAMNAL